jgi:hypothetical protein
MNICTLIIFVINLALMHFINLCTLIISVITLALVHFNENY